MQSLSFNSLFALPDAVAIGFTAVESAAAITLVNGDFETGDLTGWTTFTTSNGTIGSLTVVPFDTNNDSIATNSAQFRVGQNSFASDSLQGGGIRQALSLFTGSLTITADIASYNPNVQSNASGGIFDLLLNGRIVDRFDFGSISANTTKFGLLASVNSVLAGRNTIAIRMLRPFETSNLTINPTPLQYIGNIKIGGTATIAPISDPAAIQTPALHPGLIDMGVAGCIPVL